MARPGRARQQPGTHHEKLLWGSPARNLDVDEELEILNSGVVEGRVSTEAVKSPRPKPSSRALCGAAGAAHGACELVGQVVVITIENRGTYSFKVSLKAASIAGLH
jgi:hypothetical protein